MPPKRLYGNRDDSDDEEEDTESSDTSDSESTDEEAPAPKRKPEASAPPPAPTSEKSGRGIANKPHDEEFDVEDERHLSTPPGGSRKPQPGATKQATITPASKSSGNVLRNNPNDETFDVDDDRGVSTPPRPGNAQPGAQKSSGAAPAQAGRAGGSLAKGNQLHNTSHDEFDDVEDDMGTETPRQAQQGGGAAQAGNNKPGSLNPSSLVAPGAKNVAIRNDHHDEAIDISPGSSPKGSSTPGSSTKKQPMPQAKPTGNTMQSMKMVPRDDESSSAGSDDEAKPQPKRTSDGTGGMRPVGQTTAAASANKIPEYNPQDYAHLNARASREVQELFTYITAYQPVMQELPSKLRPFIPDYIPSVGDLDPFCKIPRPDGRPDYLGLHVVDEPCANQSNPAVVKIGLQYQSKVQSPAVFVDCVEDAANRPNVIDKWVADIKKLHYKKPLPTVNYSKPMPDIEALLQVWPQEFEDLLNSDLQFPPTQVDLDIDQYVRVMCSILDIPTYGNLIESLHVMFTLYMEFRANQHFQHA